MTAEEATMVTVAEEAILAVETEEAIEDKDKSSHRLNGGSNKDEGSSSDSDSVCSGGFDEIPVMGPARFRRDSDVNSGKDLAAGPTR